MIFRTHDYGRRELGKGFSAEVDEVDEQSWYGFLERFDDANIYQTWAYGLVRSGAKNISHLILKKRGKVVAIAQTRLARVPVIGAGIAYVMWGPVWHEKNEPRDKTVFRQAIRALRNEYVVKRRLLLRAYPVLFEEDHACFRTILEEESFTKKGGDNISQTIIMDLSPTLDEIYGSLRRHWRRELKVALKKDLEIIEGDSDALLESFIEIYREMVARKRFREPNDILEFRKIQAQLPLEHRMSIILCRSSSGLCAGLIYSAIGAAALYLFGATSNRGMKSRGSYLLQWELIQRLKNAQVHEYDLNGVNPGENPGTYKFKNDLAGNLGREVHFLGRYESCESMTSFACVGVGEKLRGMGSALRLR